MRILLVSDVTDFSTIDVYRGYCNAFTNLGVNFEGVNTNVMLETHSAEIAFGLILSKLHIKANQFSHILLISGVAIPQWFCESKLDKKLGIISTDDPQASAIHYGKPWVDYYFANEKIIADETYSFYVPTAASKAQIEADKTAPGSAYCSDVVFIGSMYPNRIKPLENLLEWCEAHDKVPFIAGSTEFVPKKSIINKYAKSCHVDNADTLRLYANSKLVINLDRDVKWNPVHAKGKNQYLTSTLTPYSTNPRAYEVAICKVPQLFIEPRQEAIDIFGDNAFYCSTEDTKKTLDIIFNMKPKQIATKVANCYKNVVRNHTYDNRAARIIDVLIRR